jgi:hypothetical protein
VQDADGEFDVVARGDGAFAEHFRQTGLLSDIVAKDVDFVIRGEAKQFFDGVCDAIESSERRDGEIESFFARDRSAADAGRAAHGTRGVSVGDRARAAPHQSANGA